MKLRSQMLAAFLLAALIPLVALALVVRHEMTSRLTAQSKARVDALVGVIEQDVKRESDDVHAALAQIRDAISSDNRFRRAAVDNAAGERRYLLDFAGNAMRLAGLDMLQVQDAGGRIVSSGHFRNDYDRVEPELPTFMRALPGRVALVNARTAGSPLLVLAGIDTVAVGPNQYTLIGGVEARALGQISGTGTLRVALELPGHSRLRPDSTRAIVRDRPIPYYDTVGGAHRMAAFRVTGDLAEIAALRASIDRWFAVAIALAVAFIVAMALLLASHISAPLTDLAQKTASLDLDRLDADFATDRSDEVGTLSRGLDAMTSRLRESTARLKEAERRATLGDLARQVNHDIKNGLTPLRNVFRHLVDQSGGDPAALQKVVRERAGTIDESLVYLDTLATNYARLARRGTPERCDLNDTVRRVAALARGRARVETKLAKSAVVDADPVALRRIVENLVENAVQSLENPGGNITLETESDASRARLLVSDTGRGMNDEQRARIFEDFYTTKPDGTGLGLSIVRRLVMDLGGTVRAESREGGGSRFVVDLPAAGTKGGA
jgi:signal transduction histidine kinase